MNQETKRLVERGRQMEDYLAPRTMPYSNLLGHILDALEESDKRVVELEKCVSLLNSMVRGGESHSDLSMSMVKSALESEQPDSPGEEDPEAWREEKP